MTRRGLTLTVAVAVWLSTGTYGDAGNVTDEPKEPQDKNVAGLCSPDQFSSSSPGPISCCQDGNRMWRTNNGTTLAFTFVGTACTEEDGVGTNCGEGSSPLVQCTYSPCGTRNEKVVRAREVHIFQPLSKPNKCGWSVIDVFECSLGCDWPTGAVRENPEPFDGFQGRYPGLVPACRTPDALLGESPLSRRSNFPMWDGFIKAGRPATDRRSAAAGGVDSGGFFIVAGLVCIDQRSRRQVRTAANHLPKQSGRRPRSGGQRIRFIR